MVDVKIENEGRPKPTLKVRERPISKGESNYLYLTLNVNCPWCESEIEHPVTIRFPYHKPIDTPVYCPHCPPKGRWFTVRLTIDVCVEVLD